MEFWVTTYKIEVRHLKGCEQQIVSWVSKNYLQRHSQFCVEPGLTCLWITIQRKGGSPILAQSKAWNAANVLWRCWGSRPSQLWSLRPWRKTVEKSEQVSGGSLGADPNNSNTFASCVSRTEKQIWTLDIKFIHKSKTKTQRKRQKPCKHAQHEGNVHPRCSIQYVWKCTKKHPEVKLYIIWEAGLGRWWSSAELWKIRKLIYQRTFCCPHLSVHFENCGGSLEAGWHPEFKWDCVCVIYQ